jgi:hypothetical protein
VATTLLDVITDALGDIGVLAEGEVPSAAQAALGLRAMNNLVDQWKAEKLVIYTTTRTLKTITVSDGEYTVGSGADINIARPVFIDHINLVDTAPAPDLETPLTKLTDETYAAIAQKALTSALPTSWYYNPTFPLGTLTLWPVPTQSGLQLALYVPTAVTEFTATSDSVSLPPGYKRMLVKSLAVELLPSYGRQPDPLLLRQAASAEGVVKRSNARLVELQFEGVIQDSGSGYDIRVGP